jgi:hypothetical protein
VETLGPIFTMHPPKTNAKGQDPPVCGESWPFLDHVGPQLVPGQLGGGREQTDQARSTWLSHPHHFARSEPLLRNKT